MRTQPKCQRFYRAIGLIGMMIIGIAGYSQTERTFHFPKTVDYPQSLPARDKVWIFILAGQSNMAGRGVVAASDTVPNERILSINSKNEVVVAKEPLHFYEPTLTGLDCGMSFARRLLGVLNEDISILLIPVAVGGSSSHQWLGDSLHRGVRLMTNFQQRVSSASKHGVIKGILWHQGESDTNDQSISGYGERLEKIFLQFRQHCRNPNLSIIIGKLGSFSDNQVRWNAINAAIERYTSLDNFAWAIETADLRSKDDKIHFDSEGQRIMGSRMADRFLKATGVAR